MADNPEVKPESGITGITVSGFKSLKEESHIEVRPLTMLAGANSSGKSSIMQPLLLMKQTLEAPYDPGPLLLDGPNVKFTRAEQLFVRIGESYQAFEVQLQVGDKEEISTKFYIQDKRDSALKTLNIQSTKYLIFGEYFLAHESMSADDIAKLSAGSNIKWYIKRIRCFLDFTTSSKVWGSFSKHFVDYFYQIIHISGIRGNPERAYRITPVVGPNFQGSFEPYVAGIIRHWQSETSEKLILLSDALKRLGLTSQIAVKPVDDTKAEVRVGRLLTSTEEDMVSIADVGFGVSQVLPVVVALLVAEPGQLVYLEQPELHLHPRAQIKLAQLLADAANRGVRVVVETHSSLLLLGVQTLVAEGKLAPEKVILHWFTRGEDGFTTISSRDLDENGAYGDWPEDFGDIELNAKSRYLDAVESRMFG